MAKQGESPGKYCLHSRKCREKATIEVLSLAFGLASGREVTAEEKLACGGGRVVVVGAAQNAGKEARLGHTISCTSICIT